MKKLEVFYIANKSENLYFTLLGDCSESSKEKKGVSYKKINEKLSTETYLRKGTIELFDYLKKNNFIIILCSGNIVPVLKFYQELLNIDYIFGTNPKMNGELIKRIDISDFSSKDFKYDACLNII